MEPVSSAKAKKFEFIDAMRGLAAVAVFYFHAVYHVLWEAPTNLIEPGTFTWHFLHHDFNLGRFAVSLFFLVSGFLIPSTLRQPGATIRAFVIHRAFRLYPAYWLSIVLFVIYHLIFNHSYGAPVRDIFINLTMFQKFFGVPDCIGAFWTLQIELIFYILCGIMFLCGLLKYQRVSHFLCCMSMIAMAMARYMMDKPLPVAIPLALSLMSFADLIRSHSQSLCATRTLLWSAIFTAVCLVPTCLLSYADFGWGAVLSNWAAIVVFLLSYYYQSLFADIKIIRIVSKFFGDISYSFYLLHSMLGLMLAGWLYKSTASFPLAFFTSFCFITLISFLAYHLVEVPGIRLGRSIARSQNKPNLTKSLP